MDIRERVTNNYESITMLEEVSGSKLWLIHFYQEQLDYYDKVGLGKFTEFGIRITKELIAITKKRLDQLTIVYDKSLTAQAHVFRRTMRQRLREKLLNGSTHGNGTTATKTRKDNSDNGHEREKS